MKSTLCVEQMDSILNECLHPVHSHCALEPDGTLTIQFRFLGDEFTIVGIGKDEFRDAQALRDLGKSLVAEIEVAINMFSTPVPARQYAT